MAINPAPIVWAPSSSRIILLWSYAALGPRRRPPAALPLRWRDKPAAAVLDYTLDATALLADASDSLSCIATAPGSLLIRVVAIHGGIVTLLISGGVIGTDETIDLRLSTASGRRVHRIARMGIKI